MRITVYQKTYVSLLSLVVLLVVVNTLFVPCVRAQAEKSLFIEIYDSETSLPLEDNVFFEGKSYDITVGVFNETDNETEFILGVNITVPWAIYSSSNEAPIVTIQTPRFEDYDSFTIMAIKEGYLSSEVEITVMKGELFISVDSGTVEEQKEFQVTIKDQNNTPVKDARVYIDPESEPTVTDIWGIAFLEAPEVMKDTTVTIQVIKNGYAPKSTTIRVEHVEGFTFTFDSAILLQILPLLFAVLAVIFAILIVRWRQKKSSPPPHPVTRDQQPKRPQVQIQEKQGRYIEKEHSLFTVNEPKKVSVSTPDSRVEEIRIPLQEKKKETTIVSKEKESGPPKQKNDENEWFKGQEYMRYKLDEITGKIDEKTDGKWFEGERDSKYKVDETLKKGWKKKKGEDEDVK
jgi:hypothetical protein